MQNATPEPPHYPIGSVDNALKLLLQFRDCSSLRVADAAEMLGVARSTAHRMLAMLTYNGFVAQDEITKAYVPGPALVEVGLSVVRNMDVRRVARPFLERASTQTGETVHLGLLQGANVVLLDAVEGSFALRVSFPVGVTVPAHASSMGKALLAEMPEPRLHQMYRSSKIASSGPRTITSRAELDRVLAQVRETGYGTSIDEIEEGTASVGVAIPVSRGLPVTGLAIALPTTRATNGRIKELASIAIDAAAGVSGAMTDTSS